MSRVILGIDPGIATLGWGIIKVKSLKLKVKSTRKDKTTIIPPLSLVDYGCIKTLPETEMPQRLRQIHLQLCELIKNHQPDLIAIERLFFGMNSKTAMVVGQARGIILLATAPFALKIAEYAPLQVKSLLTGYGRTKKDGMREIVQEILKLKEKPKSDDAADALAIAICAAIKEELSNLKLKA